MAPKHTFLRTLFVIVVVEAIFLGVAFLGLKYLGPQ
jgi:hypothetical protein